MRAGRLDSCLRAPTALIEDLGTVLSTHAGPLTTTPNSSSRKSDALLCPLLVGIHTADTETYTCIEIEINTKKQRISRGDSSVDKTVAVQP